MTPIVLLAALLCLAEAKPSINPQAMTDIDLAVIGGSDATPGAWPWQLSQQRFSTSWSHSCGASLLTSRYALSASHCVDGRNPNQLRVIAGLHDRSSTLGTQTSGVSSYKMHENYNDGTSTYANDIAILTLATAIQTGSNVAFATLPPNDHDDFAGDTCVVSGWGRTSSSSSLPNILQQADMRILANNDCASRIGSIGTIATTHICVYDNIDTNESGVCNGDSGGPLNCPHGGGYYVAGVTSWVVSNSGNCLVTYPQVYARTSTFLQWIADNTP